MKQLRRAIFGMDRQTRERRGMVLGALLIAAAVTLPDLLTKTPN